MISREIKVITLISLILRAKFNNDLFLLLRHKSCQFTIRPSGLGNYIVF